MKKPDIDLLLQSKDNYSVIDELHAYITDLCSHGDDLSKLTEPQKHFFFIQELERGVDGFDQYFYNSSGRFAHEALAALDVIGAEVTAGIVNFAISCFLNEQVPKDDEERRKQLEEMSKDDKNVLYRMTQTFYEYPEDLKDLSLEYVRANRAFF
jgi:hypothetical protein